MQYIDTDQYPSGSGWTDEQKTSNAEEIYTYLKNAGLSLASICGILGNMEKESFINPGQHQVGGGGGLGLIQWTPASDLTDYVSTWYDGYQQLNLILQEGNGTVSGRWLKSYATGYTYTWSEYCALTNVYTATRAYFYERERGTWGDERITYAVYWYNYFNGQEPDPDPDPGPDPGPTPTPTPSDTILKYGGGRENIRRNIIHR